MFVQVCAAQNDREVGRYVQLMHTCQANSTDVRVGYVKCYYPVSPELTTQLRHETRETTNS